MNALHATLSAFVALALPVLTSGCANHCAGCKIELPPKSDFEHTLFTPARKGAPAYSVYRTKTQGPPVLVLHEANGLAAPTLDFARELGTQHGWSVYAPVLFGHYGAGTDNFAAAVGALKTKLSPNWKTKDMHSSGPVLDDVAEMVGWISRMHGGRRVIVMGNCLTGGFPLALLGRPDVKAAILCQPALPYQSFLSKETTEYNKSFGISREAIDQAIRAMKRDSSKRLLGFHYDEDQLAPMEKFDALHDALGSGLEHRFRPVVLYPIGSEKKGTRSWANEQDTEVKRSFLKPHNTVTTSGSPADRKRMRTLLYRQLDAIR